MNEQLETERRLTAIEERSKSNTHRLDAVEKRQDSFDKLVSSVEVLATRQEVVESDVKEIKVNVMALKEKPAKRWETLALDVIKMLIAAALGFVLAHVGL